MTGRQKAELVEQALTINVHLGIAWLTMHPQPGQTVCGQPDRREHVGWDDVDCVTCVRLALGGPHASSQELQTLCRKLGVLG